MKKPRFNWLAILHFAMLFLVCLLCLMQATAGERIVLESINAGKSQFVSAKVYVADESWNIYRPQSPSEFIVREGGVSIPLQSFSCPTSAPVLPCPILIMADASALSGANSAVCRRLISTLAAALPSDSATLAAAVFGERPYLLQDFTTNKSAVAAAFFSFPAGDGSNFSNALLMQPAGALPLVRRHNGSKAIVLITDSYGAINADSVIRLANSLNARIICVSLQAQLTAELRRIADETSGFVLEDINTESRAEEATHRIYWQLGGVLPCEITWKSIEPCSPGTRSFLIEHIRTGAQSLAGPFGAAQSLPALEVLPKFIDFGCVNHQDSIVVTLKASGGAIVLQSAISDNSDFIADVPAETTIQDGGEFKLTVKYSPSDSLFTSAQINILSDVCPVYLTASAGCNGQRLRPKTVTIVAPNGGEELVAGDTAHIVWRGTPAGGITRAEYSLDGGISWKFIAEGNGMTSFDWIVPSESSQRCLLRVVYFRSLNQQITLKGHNGTVNSARFSNDGALLVTASADKNIRVFDVKTGANIHGFPFIGENSGVKCAEFSPDGNDIAAVAAGNLSVYVLNAVTGKEHFKLDGHSDGINTCEYSHDGKYLLTGGRDLTTRLWKIAENIGIASLVGHSGEVTGARFRETVTKIGADTLQFFTFAAGDKTIADYIAAYPPGNVERQSYSLPVAVRAACYSPVAKQYAVALAGGIIRITSDLNRSGEELSVQTIINDLDFSPDGQLIAVACEDNSARIFNVKSGKEVTVFKGHTSAVLSVRFSRDGTRIATAAADSSARIWDVNIMPIQADTSNNFWRMGIKRLWAKPCDFGAVAVGSVSDSSFTAAVCNGGSLLATIDSVVISSGTPQFEVSGGFPRTLVPDSCASIRLRFMPTEEKTYSAVCSVYSGGRIAREFAVSGVGTRVALQTVSIIDFGFTETGTFKDSAVRILIRNNSAVALSIDSVKLASTSAGFGVLDAGNTTLAPGEIRSMELRFEPLQNGRRSDRLQIHYSESGRPNITGETVAADLFGEGICTPTSGFARIVPADNRMETESGRQIRVKIGVVPPDDIPVEKLPASFSATVQCNASLLLPITDSLRGTVSGGVRTFKIRGIRLPGQDVLISLDFYTAFGDADSTAVEITDFNWPGCIPFALPRPVYVVFSDICRAGEKPRRFVNGDKKLYLAIDPNPIIEKGNGNIKFGLRETGLARLRLTDLSGRTLRTFADGIYEAGEYSATADYDSMAAGLYMLVLETPTKVISTLLPITR